MHFANVRPTERSWQKDVLGPLRRMILGTGPIPPGLPVFGVQSLSELEEHLAEFRLALEEICDAAPKKGHRLHDLLDSLHQRSGLEVQGQLYDRKSRRLQPRWGTVNESFREMLYSYLVLSFYLVPLDYLRRCIACERFFFTLTGQRAKYCTGRCQIRSAMRRYRTRKTARASRTTRIDR